MSVKCVLKTADFYFSQFLLHAVDKLDQELRIAIHRATHITEEQNLSFLNLLLFPD